MLTQVECEQTASVSHNMPRFHSVDGFSRRNLALHENFLSETVPTTLTALTTLRYPCTYGLQYRSPLAVVLVVASS